MESLTDLINRSLAATGATKSALADTLGVRRQSIDRWHDRLPQPAILRSLALELDLPYGTVLAAALHGSGYAESLADVLGGHLLHVVTSTEETYAPVRIQETAIFTSGDAASHYAGVTNAISPGTAHTTAAAVDAAALRPHVVCYTTSWGCDTDVVAEKSWYSPELPTRLSGRGITDIRARRFTDTHKVYGLEVDHSEPGAGLRPIESAVASLRSADLLVEPGSGGSSVSRALAELASPASYRRSVPADHAPTEPEDAPNSAPLAETIPDLEPTGTPEKIPSPFDKDLTDKIRNAGRHFANIPYLWGGGLTESEISLPRVQSVTIPLPEG